MLIYTILFVYITGFASFFLEMV